MAVLDVIPQKASVGWLKVGTEYWFPATVMVKFKASGLAVKRFKPSEVTFAGRTMFTYGSGEPAFVRLKLWIKASPVPQLYQLNALVSMTWISDPPPELYPMKLTPSAVTPVALLYWVSVPAGVRPVERHCLISGSSGG